jgi:hypothetical protein
MREAALWRHEQPTSVNRCHLVEVEVVRAVLPDVSVGATDFVVVCPGGGEGGRWRLGFLVEIARGMSRDGGMGGIRAQL